MESGDKGKYLVVVVANIGALSYLCTHCQSLFSDAKRESGCPREHVARANSLDNSTKRPERSRIWPKSFIAAIAQGDAVLTLSYHGPNPDTFQGVRAGPVTQLILTRRVLMP